MLNFYFSLIIVDGNCYLANVDRVYRNAQNSYRLRLTHSQNKIVADLD